MSAASAPSSRPAQSLDSLIANAARCYRLARGTADRNLLRQLLELGADYVLAAIALGADPRQLPQPDEWALRTL